MTIHQLVGLNITLILKTRPTKATPTQTQQKKE